MADGSKRVHFEAPAKLVQDFEAVASASERTVSGELRELMKRRIAEHGARTAEPDPAEAHA